MLFSVVAFVWFNDPSRNIEQFSVDDSVSFAVKLNVTELVLNMLLFAGEFRVIEGCVSEIVKFLVMLVFVLFA